MTQPPQPPLSLTQLTPDVTKAAHLERMLDNNAASYKHYWLRAIVDELALGNHHMSFTTLVARMVASAWYPVVYFHLSLGASDKLADLVSYLQRSYHLPNDEKTERISYTVVSLADEDAQLNRLVRSRTHNVPYRLIRPFYEDELIATRGHGVPKTIMESYCALDPRVLEYEDSPASRSAFYASIERTITPLYQIALNQGYAVWSM